MLFITIGIISKDRLSSCLVHGSEEVHEESSQKNEEEPRWISRFEEVHH